MKKFTIHGSGEDFGNILAHIVAEDQTKAYNVANQVYCGTDCGWDMFPGWIIDCDESAVISRPHQFLELVKKSLNKPDKYPHMVAGRVMRNNYVRWYGENLEIINGLVSGFVQEVTPVEMDLMQARNRIRELEAALAIRQEHDWSEGSPRMKPGSMGFHHPVVPDLPVETNEYDAKPSGDDWERLRDTIAKESGFRNLSMTTVKPDPRYPAAQSVLSSTSPGIYPLRELSIKKVVEDPVVHVATEVPELLSLYKAIKQPSGDYSLECWMDSWKSTILADKFDRCLAKFFEQYPENVLLVHSQKELVVWFANDLVYPTFTINAATFRDSPLTHEQITEFVKGLEVYQLYAKMIKEFKETLR